MITPRAEGGPVRGVHLVHGVRIGGKERVVVELVRRARAAGHDDRILVFEHPRTGGPEELETGDLVVESLLRKPGVDRSYGRRLRQLVKAWQPRWIHAHNDAALVQLALAWRRWDLGPARLATLHNLPVDSSWKGRLLVRWASRRMDELVCVSEDLAERRRRGGWLGGSRVLPNGVDGQRFHPEGPVMDLRSQFEDLSEGTLVIGMVARLDQGKRPFDLVETAAEARRQGIPVALAIAGSGPDLLRVQARAYERSVPSLFLREIRDVASFLRAVDVVCLLSDHEGLPMSLLEAMACGRPVVASAVGGIPELFTGECGRGLVPPRDQRALVQIWATLCDPQERQVWGRAARAHVQTHFSLDATQEAYEELYESLAP